MKGASAEPSTPTTIHVGRQPVYDRPGDVIGYELLFRDTSHATSASSRNTYATSQVIIAAFTAFGLNELVGDRPCFVNITREFLVGDLPVPFDYGQTILEVLELLTHWGEPGSRVVTCCSVWRCRECEEARPATVAGR